ncbi:sphingosine kinase 1-like [Gadus chalcogrammus]|uniref:sphingosine kinase 1-like n=1 Tax=Gadus chalcogrammus TaxID=1042646 RepID=UPI0024C41D06|nr:sphingosine kinase 1-like [Gadus chalcogrammus]
MEPKKVDPSLINDSSQVVLYGEFLAADNPKVKFVVSLTETDLAVQKLLAPSPVLGRSRQTFNLKDCVGARSYREDDNEDSGAYFSVYFYPLKKRWMSTGVSRQRVEQCFQVASVQDPRANLEEADKWARAIQQRMGLLQPSRDGVLLSEVRRPCRVMLLVNPQSGKGQALALYNGPVQRMLHEAGVPHTLFITERKNHARELVREADLSQWDALVIISGDGLLYEVVNGLLEREDWEQAIHTPLGILPGGSGNALAASIHHYSGGPLVSSEELLVSCGFILCKGLVSRMDLTSVHLGSGQRLFSFLSLAWGFVADVDVESEKYRHVGAARFTVGTLVRLASLRVYRGRLSYLPADDGDGDTGAERGAIPTGGGEHTFRNTCSSNNALNTKRRETPSLYGPADSLLPPADGPVSGDWAVVPEEDFVLMLAMYQSCLAEDLLAAPNAALDQGVIHLMYVKAGISRASLLKLFLAMEKGTHLATGCPHLVYRRVRALRLEPYAAKGLITVDGEAVEYGPVQAQVHRGLARMITG